MSWVVCGAYTGEGDHSAIPHHTMTMMIRNIGLLAKMRIQNIVARGRIGQIA